MAPKITVFMAAYNAANYINESIKSILSQTFTDFELLIVNDGSTDETVQLVLEFNDSRIRLVHNDKNRGLVYTRNVALKEARGEYLAILDSDDIALPNRLELQYRFLQENPGYALCGGHGKVIDKDGKLLDDNRLIVPTGNEHIKMTLLFINTYVNSTVMYKTTVLKELHGYKDFAPAEDYELFIRIAEKYPVDNLDEVLVKYRDHESNTSVLHADTSWTKLYEIKKIQLTNLQIQPEKRLTDALYSILMWSYNSDLSDYLYLFTKLKYANRALNKYPIIPFEKMLFNYWFKIIYTKKAKMNALPLLLNKHLFSWSFVTSRQLRKAFKLSIKGIGRLSK
ncbi:MULTISPECIES: glycosyltransferase family 2 protein [Pedobacter]|uniref:Glycosyl transferase family 2 n=1 Tax=Pedobacter heparinus (strain ATCC 13125 / DSM 2366 / CIP 104194 / JCM 7457 / NBRC 12017 / NCIMB 9290 / NRRL B-14731 / HIM 762-3) TaxID=485917 RepID=C6XYA6_PEDHD|nr:MULTISPECIES: glycosyltransferase family A protein [Pedobacter]ACU02373.1 glycosyl transferase family 2 [Pedobacter heparinus DSM 2366]MBB5437007.1 glycosyltransferase involved in cell wall biosynthesis [Pedobacter sp. AK017]